MIRLLIAGLLLLGLAYLLHKLYKKIDLINKEEELDRVDIEGDIIDIDHDIAEERRRQRQVQDDIDNLNK